KLKHKLSKRTIYALTYIGYLLSSYMTVVDIDPPNSAVISTDAFYNKMKLQFYNIIDAK
ncbi:YolD-like family protein, partial [Bacillus thuringiensis]